MPSSAVVNKAPGDWHPTAYRTVAAELTSSLDLGRHAERVIDALVWIHYSVYASVDRLKRRQGRSMQLGPRFFLDFLHHYVSLSNQKREGLEEEQRHLNVGLDKLRETVGGSCLWPLGIALRHLDGGLN